MWPFVVAMTMMMGIGEESFSPTSLESVDAHY